MLLTAFPTTVQPAPPSVTVMAVLKGPSTAANQTYPFLVHFKNHRLPTGESRGLIDYRFLSMGNEL